MSSSSSISTNVGAIMEAPSARSVNFLRCPTTNVRLDTEGRAMATLYKTRWEVTYKISATPTTCWERLCAAIGSLFIRNYVFTKVVYKEYVANVNAEIKNQPKKNIHIAVQQGVEDEAHSYSIGFNVERKKIVVEVGSNYIRGTACMKMKASPNAILRPQPPCREDATNEGLADRIFVALQGERNISEALKIVDGESSNVKTTLIPRLLRARNEALALANSRPGRVIGISAKESYLQIPGLGRASLRILPDRSTYIVLPGIEPFEGGIKEVKYGIYISPNGKTVTVEMLSKIKKDKRVIHIPRNLRVLPILATFDHPNILVPTAILPHRTKGCEQIAPKCEIDLFDFLEGYYNTHCDLSDNPSLSTSGYRDGVSEVRDCFRYMKEVASAMQYVYTQGYLHCDLKPENVLMQRQLDGSLQTKLIDFDFLVTPAESCRQSGTPAYFDYTQPHNNLRTELHAFAKTLFRPKTLQYDEGASFVHMLSCLSLIEGRRGNAALKENIDAVHSQIVTLSNDLITGKISNYGNLMERLSAVEAAFEGSTALAVSA